MSAREGTNEIGFAEFDSGVAENRVDDIERCGDASTYHYCPDHFLPTDRRTLIDG